MQTIQISEAETDIRRILREVEQGETVVITRHGRPIVRMSPDAKSFIESEIEMDQQSVDEAMASILEIRKRTKPVSLNELLAARDEGRR